MSGNRHGRRQLRVPLDAEAVVAWGYQTQRCRVTEFSTHGLTVRGLEAPAGTAVTVALPLPLGTYHLCGVVVHRAGRDGACGIRFLELSPALRLELEMYLWSLLAAEAFPPDPQACTVVGCHRPRKARGLCSTHYRRWRRAEASK